jgi:hypothetical protein
MMISHMLTRLRRLEDGKTRLYDEVNATIQRLQEWAGQVKRLVQGAAASTNLS